ncbi:pilus assembly protein [Acinetobacter pseudolwoffii]|uniref:pilus assembly protein n=1 Tax=Acinetobacter pseudolwoffii TaxID=2053287 RepID=UPI00209A8866|nr:PilC/PilY family type IV pilus protein [Acinetobacter pseudolwoffii]MCO8090437.1 PilC/PilY family type IV pilus protein [Acinetobacter pseudolwoffii]
MKNLKQFVSNSTQGKVKKNQIAFAVSSTFLGTLVIASSVAQATDLQIYAKPEAGIKTIVMMLDTSGSMGYGDGYNDGSMSIKADYGVCSDTNTITTGTNYSDNKLYKVSSSTTPAYDRYFCYVGKTSASNVPEKVKNTVTGCEKLNDEGTRYRCYDRMTRLKDGMFAFLDSADPSLNQVKVGLGNYSVDINGDGKADSTTGAITVAAEPLEGLGSAQRIKLKTAVKNLVAWNGTPTAHAYAEAASYLMGTDTRAGGNVRDFYKKRTTYTNELISYDCPSNYQNKRNNNGYCYVNSICTSRGSGCRTDSTNKQFKIDEIKYYGCKSWSGNSQICGGNDSRRQGVSSSYWTDGETNPSYLDDLGDYQSVTLSNNDVIYRRSQDSGFFVSDTSTRNSSTYISPLPEKIKRQTCDGQGVFVLSDGAANSTDETRSSAMMSTALGSLGQNFSCAGGLSEAFEGTNPGGWRCMGEFAKRLFDPTKNPSETSIQTAFVGFGSDMSDLSKGFVGNACKLSSRTQEGRKGDDSCSPDQPTYGVSNPGYGNGGFFIASQPTQITASVIQFINNLGENIIDPLSTGAISVPVDSLNPHTYQPYGYLRALEPKPGTQDAIWVGNLKKYEIKNGALMDGALSIFKEDGSFRENTQDEWHNSSNIFDGVRAGGVFGKVKYATVTSTSFRPIFVDKDDTKTLVSVVGTANNAAALLQRFNGTDLNYLSFKERRALLNYLGYDLTLDNTALPTALTAPNEPFLAMGASIHSFPVQLTYSGTIDANGELTNVRSQSILYGSMEGAVRTVNASNGEEQMVYVPSEILKSSNDVVALRKGESSTNGPKHGISGAWVSDASYKITGNSAEESTVEATKMYVYGGMRMGGKSYFGLDLTTPTAPKQLFKITGGVGDYSRMGQTWSKPVLGNIRFRGKPTRVMIVGGGYDMCYENPRFVLNTENPSEFGGETVAKACKKAKAEGNAVYIINAETGERIWWASDTGANNNNASMKHSIASRISTLDRDADGFIDHLYFGDLGGQVFRIDLDNSSAATALGKRVVRLANLATKEDGTAITNGDQPRFYQPPTLTVHDEGNSTFLVVGIASGDRSTPLDVFPLESQGRDSMLPSTALRNRPVNHVFGLIDYDVADKNLYSKADSNLITKEIILSKLQENPQLLTGKVAAVFSAAGKKGWYRSLSSDYTGEEVEGRTSGGIKAFEEEPIALTGRLFVPIYDPEGTGVDDPSDACQPRIVGETNLQQYCLPYGACLNTTTGLVDIDANKITGMMLDEDGKNQNVLGAGIRGVSMGPLTPGSNPASQSNCGSLTILGLLSGKGEWSCNKILNPTRWYEKHVEIKNN